MSKKIYGLSPNFLSVISPNVPESLFLRWTFIPQRRTETQEKATIRIYKKNYSTPLLELNVQSEQEVSIESKVSMFVEESEYLWEVEAVSSNGTKTVSDKATFRFASVEMHDELVWPNGPQSYEQIGSRKYFTEIRENTISVMGDYVLSSNDEIDTLLNLQTIFTGSIVPHRKDFEVLEKALLIIATKERTSKESILKLIEDGLDATDIHKIYEILNHLSQIPPYQPTNFSVVIDNPPMYGIESAKAINNNESDTSIQTEWQVGSIKESISYILFDDEKNSDVSYYKLDIITGFEDSPITHSLYYRIKDLNKIGNKIYFRSQQNEYQNTTTTLKSIYGFNVVAVDKRNKESINYSIVQPAPDIRLGVSHYILQNEIYSLSGAAATKPYGDDLYSGPNNRYIHHLSGDTSGFYHYRVKAVDKNGEESNWYEFGPVRIDTLTQNDEIIPPDDEEIGDGFEEDIEYFPVNSPKKTLLSPPPITKTSLTEEKPIKLEEPKPVVFEITNNSASINWRAVKNADRYEVEVIEAETTTDTSFKCSYLEENTRYTVKVRSLNKNMTSDWATVSFTTSSKPIIVKEEHAILSKCWRSDYYILYQNGNQVYSKGGWRNDITDELIQGEWIELGGGAQINYAIQAGTRWGNHKSIMIFDDQDWMAALKDKEIIRVEMYLKRIHTPHGYSNDGKALYVYTHNYLDIPMEEPALFNGFEVKEQMWNRGEGKWVTLPNKFGELIRDGEAKGIGLYHPRIHLNPPSNYSYCKFDANSIKLRIYCK